MRVMTAMLLALVLTGVAGVLGGCKMEKETYAPKNPTLQLNRYDPTMDPGSQTAPIMP